MREGTLPPSPGDPFFMPFKLECISMKESPPPHPLHNPMFFQKFQMRGGLEKPP